MDPFELPLIDDQPLLDTPYDINQYAVPEPPLLDDQLSPFQSGSNSFENETERMFQELEKRTR